MVGVSNTATVTIKVGVPHTVGLVDPGTGVWRLRNTAGVVTEFYYGVPGDYPFVGDWDCDGEDTPGLYRQSDGFAYLRNSNTQGIADLTFFFGNPGDVPIAGDFNGNGCDTLSIYRPSEARFYIINQLGSERRRVGGGGLFVPVRRRRATSRWWGTGTVTGSMRSGCIVSRRGSSTTATRCRRGSRMGSSTSVIRVTGLLRGIGGLLMVRIRRGCSVRRTRCSTSGTTLTQGNADSQFTWTGAGMGWLPVAGDFNLD